MTQLRKTERSRVRRLHERGTFDREVANAVLDAAMLCHLGYTIDGRPYCTPTLYWRDGDHVLWHGSSASRMTRAQKAGAEVCLTVTLMDALVLARSGFHHSARYRSVMLFGQAQAVADAGEKDRLLEGFIERLFPGRTAEIRAATAKELKATTLLRMPIDEGAAKVSVGPPADDEEDYNLPVWAGLLPMRTVYDAPVPCPRLRGDVGLPDYLRGLIEG